MTPKKLISLLIALAALSSPASAEWKEKVLYSFQGLPDGSVPAGGVVFDKQGNLYGATTEGGSKSCLGIAQCGTVYQLVPPTKKGDPWTENILYVFKGNLNADGATPAGGLVIDQAGNLYGTTGYGGTGSCILLGTNVGCGTVYEISPPRQKGGAWTETVLYSFPTAKQGYLPRGDLVFDSAGNLYGATEFGGEQGTTCDPYYQYCGAVFKLSPPKKQGGKWTEKTLHGFKSGRDGANPNGGLVLDSKGVIYGTTYGGGNESGECGAGGCGTAFELHPPTQEGGAWAETVLHRFDRNTPDGGLPSAGFVMDGNGYLYGTTLTTVFSFTPPSKQSGRWKEALLYTFNQEAYGPQGSLIFDKNGDLFGTTYSGNTFSGTVFRLKHRAWTFAILYGFTGTKNGAQPAAKLIFDQLGNLYSTTQIGGTGKCSFYGCGTVFVVTP
jgi:hypothetical protein